MQKMHIQCQTLKRSKEPNFRCCSYLLRSNAKYAMRVWLKQTNMTDNATQILSYLHPVSLLQLARTTRSLRRFLLNRQMSKSLVWKPAFERLYKDTGFEWDSEPCWKGLSTPKFASLLFEDACQVCHLSNTSGECPKPAIRHSRNAVSRLQGKSRIGPLYCIRRYRLGFARNVLSNSTCRDSSMTLSSYVYGTVQICVLG